MPTSFLIGAAGLVVLLGALRIATLMRRLRRSVRVGDILSERRGPEETALIIRLPEDTGADDTSDLLFREPFSWKREAVAARIVQIILFGFAAVLSMLFFREAGTLSARIERRVGNALIGEESVWPPRFPRLGIVEEGNSRHPDEAWPRRAASRATGEAFEHADTRRTLIELVLLIFLPVPIILGLLCRLAIRRKAPRAAEVLAALGMFASVGAILLAGTALSEVTGVAGAARAMNEADGRNIVSAAQAAEQSGLVAVSGAPELVDSTKAKGMPDVVVPWEAVGTFRIGPLEVVVGDGDQAFVFAARNASEKGGELVVIGEVSDGKMAGSKRTPLVILPAEADAGSGVLKEDVFGHVSVHGRIRAGVQVVGVVLTLWFLSHVVGALCEQVVMASRRRRFARAKPSGPSP